MAFTTEPDLDRRNRIAAAIGRELGSLVPSDDSHSAVLRESLLLFTVTSDDVASAVNRGGRIGDACKSDGVWHHQVEVAGRSAFFARTRQQGGDDVFLGVYHGRLGEEVQTAIEGIDKQFSDDVSGKFLCLTDSRIYMMLLASEQEERLVIISSPFSELGLSPGRVLSPQVLAHRLLRLPRRIGVDLGD